MLSLLAKNWWAVAIRGIVAITFGILAFLWPGITLTALVLLYGAYALTDGIFAVVAAVSNAGRVDRWWVLLLWGVCGILAGLITFVVPGMTALFLLYLIAFWAITTGVMEIAAAIRLRRELTGEWVLALSGVVSIVFGGLLLLYPGAGALAVIWWIGGYAIVFGGLLLALAFRLHHELPRAEPRVA